MDWYEVMIREDWRDVGSYCHEWDNFILDGAGFDTLAQAVLDSKTWLPSYCLETLLVHTIGCRLSA